MNVVGRVGSLISQGVYSVATPFHPFGGAVDVIVVQQQDGSFRGTPWYVRFGKFQGVLKGAEKIVRINVNDIEANFHMYLDNSGEAFFLNEVVPGNDSPSNGNIMNSDRSEVMREDSGIIEDSYIGSNETSVSLCRYESSVSDPGVMQLRQESTSSYVSQFVRAESDGERRFYEFQEEQSSIEASVELAEYEKNHLDRVEDYVEQQASDSEVVLFSVDGHVLTAPISATETETDTENVQLSTPQFHLGPGEGTEFVEGSGEFGTGEDAWAANYISDLDASPGKVAAEDACSIKRSSKENTDHSEVCGTEGERVFQAQETQEISNKKIDIPGNIEHASASFRGEEHFMRCLELPELATNMVKVEPQSRMEVLKKIIELPEKPDCNVRSMCETEEECVTEIRTDGESPHCSSDSPGLGRMRSSDLCVEVESVERDEEALEQFDVQSNANELEWKDAQGIVPEVQEAQCSPQKFKMEDECYQGETTELPIISSSKGVQTDSSIKFEISLCRNELQNGMGEQKAAEVFNSHIVSEEEFKLSAASIMKDDNLVIRYKGKYFSWDKAAPLVFGMAAFGLELPIDTEDAIPVEYDEAAKTGENRPLLTPASSGRRWRLWPNPFRRVKILEQISSNASNEEVFVDTESVTQSSVVEPEATSQDGNVSPHKQFKRTKIPTSEQIASLNLQEGQNIVTFSFSTRVLGTQQVDAHIYLWKWNARIVISDVDGTITKSDVLGQFMPLVGKDWTQSGVARLFCAIKENGYQLLFLSARAIVQAYLTRSFLLNLKQDGKTLPNGPIVISPDGLFPSLFREVIRRAPHEFKIACLEDIKALFPSDYNPFYAGFGNRDTDELSYLKIGIPKGKIFIINPKGEVAISHRIDVKSYTSLHTLVNDMFPPTSLVEQEDFNSWNFWKMPIPDVE